MKRAERKEFWIEVAAVTVISAVLIAGFVYARQRALLADDLAIQVSDLRSFASAGAQLSAAYSDGHVTETFFDNQSELLHEKVLAVHDALEGSKPDPSIQTQMAQAVELAHRIDDAFIRFDGSASRAAESVGTLEQLADSAKRLEDHLKRGAAG